MRARALLLAALLAPACAAGGVPLLVLDDLDGERVEVKAAGGEVVLLVFWATWCQPCQSELSELSAFYPEYAARGLRAYAVNIDAPSTAALVRPWVSREQYSFPVLLDAETQILTRYHPPGEIPYYVLLDARGAVIEDHRGYNPGDMALLRARLDEMLPGGEV